MARDTPLTRAERELERLGYAAEKVRRLRGEQRTRHRLFGLLDLVGMKPGAPLLGVRLAAVEWEAEGEAEALAGDPAAVAWLSTGARLEVWAFAKCNHRRQLARCPVPQPAGLADRSSLERPARAA